jgi:hypothetical protein
MNSRKFAAIVDHAVEVAFAEVAKKSDVQPMDLYMVGLGFAAIGLLLLNLPWKFVGLQVVGAVLIALGLITMAAIKRKV